MSSNSDIVLEVAEHYEAWNADLWLFGSYLWIPQTAMFPSLMQPLNSNDALKIQVWHTPNSDIGCLSSIQQKSGNRFCLGQPNHHPGQPQVSFVHDS